MSITRVAEVQSPEEAAADVAPTALGEVTQVAPAPQVVEVAPTTVNAKVKGTWKFVYGSFKQEFQDGHRYDLPLDVYKYLRRSGCIYDTL